MAFSNRKGTKMTAAYHHETHPQASDQWPDTN